MQSILTLNGIPSRIVGSLDQSQQSAIATYAQSDKEESYRDFRRTSVPEALFPFVAVVAGIADSYVQWGASITNIHRVSLISSHLKSGETTFKRDLNFHSDTRSAFTDLHNENLLYLRLLCVSSTPTAFIDLTAHENMAAILDQHRIEDMRYFDQELMDTAKAEGKIVTPAAWDIIMFDAITPHNPKGVLNPHRRILQHAWVEMRLPDKWQDRIKCGDTPLLSL